MAALVAGAAKAFLPISITCANPEERRLSPSSISFRASNPKFPVARLRSVFKDSRRPGIRFCLEAKDSGENCASDDSSASSSKEAAVDINLPRRSLLVQFTCNACGERSQRLVNRVAYERGTVFVQCAGCLVKHKLVDNLGLIVEYDLREERIANSDDTE